MTRAGAGTEIGGGVYARHVRGRPSSAIRSIYRKPPPPKFIQSEKVYACMLPLYTCPHASIPSHPILPRSDFYRSANNAADTLVMCAGYTTQLPGVCIEFGLSVQEVFLAWPLQFITPLKLRPSSVQRDGLVAIPTTLGSGNDFSPPACSTPARIKISFACIMERSSLLVGCHRSGPVSLANGR